MLGGPVIQEHVVEFLLGSGVKTDGVLDSTSPSGPWTWVVPMGVAQIFVTGCGAGSGGDGGTNTTNSGGGGGGGSGMYFVDFPVDVVQNTSLQVTIGAKGTGGTPTVAATAGGDTTIQFVVTPIMTDTGSTLKFLGGGAGTTSTSSNGGRGSDGGKVVLGTAGGTSAGTPTAGTNLSLLDIGGYGLIMTGGAGGGAASSTGSTAGANGGGQSSTITNFRTYFWTTVSEASGNLPTGGTGNTTGTVSRGGGGIGGSSLFGEGGNGGNGGANGTNATGYGAGGGGGGGTANGGDGSDGYLRITYWSAD